MMAFADLIFLAQRHGILIVPKEAAFILNLFIFLLQFFF